MFHKLFLAASLALFPLVHGTPAPQSSVIPSQYGWTEYLASANCEYTSTSGYGVTTNQCASVGNGLSYNFYGFQRGQDYPGDSCSFLLYNGPDCAGTPTSTVPAVSAATSACYQPGPDGNSIKLVC